MKSQMFELMDTTDPVDVSAICNKMAEQANALIDALPFEKSGARDRDGSWHGADPIAGRIDNLRKLLEELEAAQCIKRRSFKDEHEIEVPLADGRTAWVSVDDENGRVQPSARTPDQRNDFTADDWLRINANPAVAEMVRGMYELWTGDSARTT